MKTITVSSLIELWETHGRSRYITDKQDNHSYLGEYDKLFAPLQHMPITILELGHSAGGALRLFDDYFTHPQAKIIGVDLTDNDWHTYYNGRPYETSRVKTILIDIHKIDGAWFEENDIHPDIIIDDSDHDLGTQLWIVNNLLQYVNEGGMLIIEDILDPHIRIKEFNKLEPVFELVDLNGMRYTRDNALIIYRK